MNKDALARKIKETNAGYTIKAGKEAIDVVLAAIEAGLREEGKVSLAGFANFELVDKAEATKRNPATQAEVVVPAHKALKVKVSKTLKDSLR